MVNLTVTANCKLQFANLTLRELQCCFKSRSRSRSTFNELQMWQIVTRLVYIFTMVTIVKYLTQSPVMNLSCDQPVVDLHLHLHSAIREFHRWWKLTFWNPCCDRSRLVYIKTTWTSKSRVCLMILSYNIWTHLSVCRFK